MGHKNPDFCYLPLFWLKKTVKTFSNFQNFLSATNWDWDLDPTQHCDADPDSGHLLKVEQNRFTLFPKKMSLSTQLDIFLY